MAKEVLNWGELRRVPPPAIAGGEFTFEWGFESSSPVEWVNGTESGEEEDYLAGLTREMAHSFLLDDDGYVSAGGPARHLRKSHNAKVMSTSPQSTLSGHGIWAETSPPSTPLEQQERDGVLQTAAGEAALKRLFSEKFEPAGGRGVVGPGIDAAPLLARRGKQIRLEELRRQQVMRQRIAGAWEKLGHRQPDLPASAWPPLHSMSKHTLVPEQLHAGYGNRRPSTGTGVFLPQIAGVQPDSRKKPGGFSRVLLPARVVNALNLNLDEMIAHPGLPGAFILSHDALVARSSHAKGAKQLSHQHIPPPIQVPPQQSMAPASASAPPANPSAVADEFHLPAEWTY